MSGAWLWGIEMARDDIKDLKKRLDAMTDAWSIYANAILDGPDGETPELRKEVG